MQADREHDFVGSDDFQLTAEWRMVPARHLDALWQILKIVLSVE